MIRWQGRGRRRIKPGVAWRAVATAACALAGAGAMSAQAAGWLHLSGILVVVPAAMVVLAVAAQLIAAARGFAAWLAG